MQHSPGSVIKLHLFRSPNQSPLLPSIRLCVVLWLMSRAQKMTFVTLIRNVEKGFQREAQPFA